MRLLLGLFFFWATFSAHAGFEALIGSWEGGDTASMSIYGTLRISGKTISWGGHNKHNPKCQASYIIAPEEGHIVFEDQIGNIFSVDKDNRSVQQKHHGKGGNSTVNDEKRNFSTYLLQIKGGQCLLGVTQLRLTFPFENDFTYLDMIEYDKSNRPVGKMHFHKKNG